MNVYIRTKFIPDEYTLKYKRSVAKLIISSHRMEMMSMPYKVSVDIIINFDSYTYRRGFGTFVGITQSKIKRYS